VPSAAVTVTTTLENSTVIGGVQSGWNVAVRLMEKSAFPFWTGTSSVDEMLCLFAAFGLLLPGFTHCASAETVTVITSTPPRPATFPATVSVLPLRVAVGFPTKCAFETASAEPAIVSAATATPSRMRFPPD
jgi:hypothetical protein